MFAWLTKRGGFARAHNNIRDARKKATYFVWPVYQNENQEVSPGDHVVVVYVDNQRPHIGKAINVDGSDVHITFVAPYLDESRQYFRWPKSEDKIWVDFDLVQNPDKFSGFQSQYICHYPFQK